MSNVVWQARWIWKGLTCSPNEFLYFRKTFNVASAVKKARILITAESWYELYINGKFVHKGTSVSYPNQQIYDNLDISKYLKKGKNLVAVLVNYYGIPSGWSVPKQAALMAQLEINGNQVVGTDNSWKYAVAKEWKQDVVRRSFYLNLEFIEVRDYRKRISGWNKPGLDDTTWQASAELRGAPYGEWGGLEERSIDQIKVTRMLPLRIIRSGIVNDLIPPELEGHPVYYVDTKNLEKEIIFSGKVNSNSRQKTRLLLETGKKCFYSLNGGEFLSCDALKNFQKADFEIRKGTNTLKLKVPAESASGRNQNFLHFTVFPLKKPFTLGFSGWDMPYKDIAYFNAAKQMTSEEISGDECCGYEALLKGRPVTVSKPEYGDSRTIIFDVGKEVTGYPVVKIKGAPGTVVDIGCAELLTWGRINPEKSNVSYTDRFTLDKFEETVRPLEWKGFRYMQVTIRNAKGPVNLNGVYLDYIEYPFAMKGRFESSDSLLNRIYEVAAYSSNLCMRDTPMDCPWREKRPWIEDAARILMTSYYADCDYKYARSVLRQQGFLQDTRGRVWVCMTLNEEYPFQTFEWAIAVWTYYIHSGDKTLVLEMFPKLRLCTEWLVSRVNKDGVFINDVQGTYQWIDNSFSQVYGAGLKYSFSVMNAKFAFFLDTMSKVYTMAGRKKEASDLLVLAKRIRANIVKRFWNKEKGLFNDTIYGDGKNNCSEVTNGGAVAFDVVKGKTAQSLLSRVMNGNLPIEASPSHKFHIYEALLRYGHGRFVIANIKKKFKYMLDKDATTFWERWEEGNIQDGTSWCHGWSGYPAAIFAREILGVKPVEAGFSKVTVRPKCFDLDWAKGEVPTPKGNIKVEWKAKDGKIVKLKIKAPKGIKVIR